MAIPKKLNRDVIHLMKNLESLPNVKTGHFVIGYFPSKDLLVMGDRKIDKLLTVVKEASKVTDLTFQLDEKKNSLTIQAESIGLDIFVVDASNSIAVHLDSPRPLFGSSRSFLDRVERNKEDLCMILARQLNAWI
jgi:hypothetical protein